MGSNKVLVEACGNDNSFQKQNFPPGGKTILEGSHSLPHPFMTAGNKSVFVYFLVICQLYVINTP